MKTQTPQMIYLTDYEQPHFWIDEVDLTIRLNPTATRVKSRLAINPNHTITNRGPLILDGEDLKLITASLNGTKLNAFDYKIENNTFILLEAPDQKFEIELEVEINPQTNTQLMGLYLSDGIFCTQCEAEGFRRITYFPDRPDVMSVYNVRLEAEKATVPILLSNGNPGNSGDMENGWHFAQWHDPHPKPCYLFAIVGGKLDVLEDKFTTQSGKIVDLAIYVEPGKANQAPYAMEALKRSMTWDEEVFGCEYDLDIFNIVAVSNFNMGAMENKGLNIFNDKYVLASPETATDADYENIEAIIAHEYFHNWTGNRITCRDWFQLCLKEGLTVFRDQEFSADMRSRTVQRIKDVKRLKAAQFPEDAGPLSHPVRPDRYSEINNFYTATVYEKGAELIRMLKTLLGAQGFKAGMDLYFERHDGDATIIEAFLTCFTDATGFDLKPFLNWYNQSGTPEVKIDQHYDPQDLTLTMTITQQTAPNANQDTKAPQVIPIKMGLITSEGKELPIDTTISEHSEIMNFGDCLILDSTHATVTFNNIPPGTIASVFRHFSAPVNVIIDHSQDDLALIALNDSDDYNRWSALQALSEAEILRIGQGQYPNEVTITNIAKTLETILNDQNLDEDFKALCLALPTLGDLMRQQGQNVIPEALATARKAFAKAISIHMQPALMRKYQSIITIPSNISAATAGRRSLRHACLALMKHGMTETDYLTILKAHYEQSSNMTEKSFALDIACQLDHTSASDIIKDFEMKYGQDALVMDKWLSSQSSSFAGNNAIDKVIALLEHPHFSRQTPNRVYALLGGFGFRNLRAFHAMDGSGYEFMADQILIQDKINPQIAARLLTAFRSWRTLHSELQTKATIALRRMDQHPTLSKDVKDILTRTLGG